MTTAPAHAGFPQAPNLIGPSRPLVVQTRMGFHDIPSMRRGLTAVRDSGTTAVGTITLDSFTRTNQHDRARRALERGESLNGYPIVAHGAERTRELLDGVVSAGFPVQMRHGSAKPFDIFRVMLDSGVTATEGGPVSYCLPYSRVPLEEATAEWSRSCDLLASHDGDHPVHLETFGGCLLGQLCPPELLVALSVLEARFFTDHGLRSVSLSYAQQTHAGQDAEALMALRTLASRYLPADTAWHVVLYTYMGVYPHTPQGALRLLADSAVLATATGCERLIVKTVAESVRIPTVAENIQALRHAASAAAGPPTTLTPDDSGLLERTQRLIDAVLDLEPTTGRALVTAFKRGVLDVPYCLHPDNMNRARANIDRTGRLIWTATGRMPLGPLPARNADHQVTAAGLLGLLAHVQRSYDTPAEPPRATPRAPAHKPLETARHAHV
ncbi:methylaspartate mutase [Streptomyces sp. NPDC002812]|uniref:methylaspartate mutase n=1 Tax=Streptomyces sp. NPDC002812 TaxID=3154434 RepID=UPI00332D73DD